MDLSGYIYDQSGNAKEGLTVELYTTAGALTASTTTNVNGYWEFTGQASQAWMVKRIDGTKVLWRDGRTEDQLTNLDVVTAITTDTINEHTSAAGVTIDTVLVKDGKVDGIDVSAHDTATTGVHGVGAGTIAKTADITATKLDDLTAPDDNTDLDASTSKHGLVVKATAPASGLVNVVGIANAETAYTNKPLFDATVPENQTWSDSAAAGTATVTARRDHKHGMMALPKLDDLTAPDDNTDLDASTSKHGLVVKATAPAANVLNVVGIGNGETAYTNKGIFDGTAPTTQAFGDAATAGTAVIAAHRDHKHAMPAVASSSDITTGTDNVKAVTADGFAGSNYGKRVGQIQVLDASTALTTGDGKAFFFIPPELNGYNLVDIDACVNTVSSSGLPSIAVYNVTDSVDMLTVNITIDANEKTSYTATTPPTIDTTHDDVATGDEIRIDIDGAGTGTRGLYVIASFQLP